MLNATKTHLLASEQKLISPLFREIFLGQKILPALEVIVRLVLVSLWNTIIQIVLRVPHRTKP